PQLSHFAHEHTTITKRIFCWAHVFRNYKNLVSTLKSEQRKGILEDIYFLQQSHSFVFFKNCIKLINSKYSNFNEYEYVMKILNNNFFAKNNTWFEGIETFSPNTNNAPENFKRIIKEKYLSYKKRNIIQFIYIVLKICDDVSISYEKLRPVFHLLPITNLDEIGKKYFDLVLLEESVDFKQSITIPHFINSIQRDFNLVDVANTIKEGNTDDLRKLKELKKTFSIINHALKVEGLEGLQCTCKNFLKKYVCKHIYKYILENNLESLCNVQILGIKKLEGRPKNIKPGEALKKNKILI
ncbi:hypothetical protein TUBRATIS_27150, partial [Tubulinosema ratisbonensis]